MRCEDRGSVGESAPGRAEARCPGCGLRLPRREGASYVGYFHTTAECWALFEEVLAADYSHAVVFARAHQLAVDAYAVQHAGGPHPDKSIAIHLVGLHLALERGVPGIEVAPRLQRLAERVGDAWPHFPPPSRHARRTVFDVALVAGSPAEQIRAARGWAEAVWRSWREHHAAVAALAARHLPLAADDDGM